MPAAIKSVINLDPDQRAPTHHLEEVTQLAVPRIANDSKKGVGKVRSTYLWFLRHKGRKSVIVLI